MERVSGHLYEILIVTQGNTSLFHKGKIYISEALSKGRYKG